MLLMIMTQGNWLVFEIEPYFSLVWYKPLQRPTAPAKRKMYHDGLREFISASASPSSMTENGIFECHMRDISSRRIEAV